MQSGMAMRKKFLDASVSPLPKLRGKLSQFRFRRSPRSQCRLVVGASLNCAENPHRFVQCRLGLRSVMGLVSDAGLRAGLDLRESWGVSARHLSPRDCAPTTHLLGEISALPAVGLTSQFGYLNLIVGH